MTPLARFLPLLLAILAGCSTPAYLEDSGLIYWKMEHGDEDDDDDTSKRARYEGLLAKYPLPDQEYPAYSQLLEEALAGVSPYSPPVGLGAEESLGIAIYYDTRCEAVAELHRRLARISMDAGEWAAAEERIKQALAAAKRSRSPFLLSESSFLSYSLLEEVHQGARRPLQAMMAKLHRRMLEDYRRSPRGQRDYVLHQAAHQADMDRVADLNDHLLEVDWARQQIQAAQFNAALSGFNSVVQGMTLQVATIQAGGVETPQIRQMRMQFQLNNQIMQLSKMVGETVKTFRSTYSPASNATFVGALVDEDMGVDPIAVIKEFSVDVQGATEDEGIRASAKQVAVDAEAVVKARPKGEEATLRSAATFTKTFGQLEERIEARN